MSAATFSRPATLPGSWKVQRPQVIDDEFLQHVGEGFQPPGLRSYFEGFVYSLSLFEILDDVLASIYHLLEDDNNDDHQNHGKIFATRLANTLLLNSRLDNLIDRIPNHLRLTNHILDVAGQTKRSFQVQAETLQYRFVHEAVEKSKPANPLPEFTSCAFSFSDRGYSKKFTSQKRILLRHSAKTPSKKYKISASQQPSRLSTAFMRPS